MNRRSLLKMIAGLPALAFVKPKALPAHVEHATWANPIGPGYNLYFAANQRVHEAYRISDLGHSITGYGFPPKAVYHFGSPVTTWAGTSIPYNKVVYEMACEDET